MTKRKTLNYIINLSFFLYFIILIFERLLSILLSKVSQYGINLYGTVFHGYTYTLVFVSIACFLIYLIIYCRDNIKALLKLQEELDFNKLCIASGILLLSGMVHTEYTTPIIQFISYGILIIGILLKVVLNQNDAKDKPLLWLSFCYLVSLSMAIPVMYRSFIKMATLFHVLEAISSFALVCIFTYLLVMIFGGKDDLFIIWPIIITIILDTTLIIMRWDEEINLFVLIFLSLSVLLFVVGTIYKKISSKQNK